MMSYRYEKFKKCQIQLDKTKSGLKCTAIQPKQVKYIFKEIQQWDPTKPSHQNKYQSPRHIQS